MFIFLRKMTPSLLSAAVENKDFYIFSVFKENISSSRNYNISLELVNKNTYPLRKMKSILETIRIFLFWLKTANVIVMKIFEKVR